ncbi:mannose binding [Homalodisca vitripennis]|nr:mannose binding [Homalodisca vitripennis]
MVLYVNVVEYLRMAELICTMKEVKDAAQCPCVSQQDCPADQSCIEQICESPCPSLCGDFTICQVDDHITSCYCEPGYSGDPYIGCYDQCKYTRLKFKIGRQSMYSAVFLAERGGNSGILVRYSAWTIRAVCNPNIPPCPHKPDVEIMVNWHTAFAYCLQLGGRLATIESREENVLVKDVIVKSGLGTQFWISGAEYSHQGHWTWMSTGRPFNFTDWSPGQPDNYQGVAGGEHCLELREDYQYLWNDGNCPKPHFPICEYYD